MQFRELATFVEKNFVGHFDRRTGREHGVREDDGLADEVRAGAVLRVDMEGSFAVVLAVGGHECVLRRVEAAEDAFVQRETGAHDGGDHHLLVRHAQAGCAERGHDLSFPRSQRSADFIAEDLTETLQVRAEPEAVFLKVLVAELRDEAVENRTFLSKVDDFHIISF